MLRDQDYEVIDAAIGEAGLLAVHQHHPDLILLDINLPDIDGEVVCQRIRADETVACTLIIALTANAMHGDRERFLAIGMDGYIPKPVTRTELLNTIRQFLTVHQGKSPCP